MSRPLNVILVEDNPDDVFLMRAILKKAALIHSLVVLEDGAQAIEYMRKLAEAGPESFPDLMFVDLNLPRKNGHEVLAEIRKYHNLDKLPIVVLTTSEDPQDRARALAKGALTYTSKPPNLITLNQILHDAHLDGLGGVDSTNLAIPAVEPGQTSTVERLKAVHADAVIKPVAEPVLLIEDSPTDALLMREILRKSAPGAYDLEVASDVASALVLLAKRSFKVILADLGLPDARGLEVLTKLQGAAEGIPIVILTGLDDESNAAEAVQNGAQDYLVKGTVDGDRLVRSIRYAIMRKHADELARLAITIENNALKEILQHAPVSIARFDADLTVLACNPVFTKQLALDSKSILGLPMDKLLPGLNQAHWQHVVSDGVPIHEDRFRPRIDSDLVWDLTAWPVTTSAGGAKGGITIGVDITERIKLERQREDFIAALAHDIKNPLVGVDRILTALSDSPLGQLDSEQGNYLALLKESNESVLNLLQNLLEVYRYDTSAAHLHRQTLDPALIIRGSVASASAGAVEKNVVVDLQLAPDLRLIQGDPVALQRLFTNLLLHALQFSPANSQIKTTAENLPERESGVLFKIVDSGPGMTPDELERLFKRFGQNNDVQLQVGSANHLGLFLCKQIVDAHEGTIGCQSIIGQGTTITVVLY